MKKGSKDFLRTALQLKRTIIICTVTALLVSLTPSYGAGEDQLPWEITADRITHEQDPEKVIAEGNVFLQQYKDDSPTGLEIKADKIRYNVNENSVKAYGNLRLTEKYNEVRASEAQIDLSNQIGAFKKASIFWRNNNLSVSADLIEKRLKKYIILRTASLLPALQKKIKPLTGPSGAVMCKLT